VRSTGKALSDGYIGQEISVKNRQSNRTVVGVVTSSGDVQVAVR